jgi:hypothetical protein
MRRYTEIMVVVLFLAMLLYGVITLAAGNNHTQPQPSAEIVSKYSASLDKLDTEAIEEAYKEQIRRLFAVWMQDATGQPTRAVSGAVNARKAFFGAMQEIEARQKSREKEQNNLAK